GRDRHTEHGGGRLVVLFIRGQGRVYRCIAQHWTRETGLRGSARKVKAAALRHIMCTTSCCYWPCGVVGDAPSVVQAQRQIHRARVRDHESRRNLEAAAEVALEALRNTRSRRLARPQATADFGT